MKKIGEVCYWKGLVIQSELFAKTCNTCQQLKNRKTIYGHLPPTNIAELKLWDLVHVYLIGTYFKPRRQHQPGGAIISNNYSLTCMSMIDPATYWFGILKIQMFDLDRLTICNDEYIDKSSAKVGQLFNNTWIRIYPRQHKVMFDNEYNFK